MTDHPEHAGPATGVGRAYVRVLIIWVVVLAALYAFQEFFS
jgi:hypothetical protein